MNSLAHPVFKQGVIDSHDTGRMEETHAEILTSTDKPGRRILAGEAAGVGGHRLTLMKGVSGSGLNSFRTNA